MSLEQWHKNGWLKPHQTTSKQIADLLAIAERDLRDAKQEALSEDWQYGIAYNAVLKLCTVLLYAEGYRPEKNFKLPIRFRNSPHPPAQRRHRPPQAARAQPHLSRIKY